MTKFTQDMTLTQYVEAGGIRFAYRRLGVPERLPLVFFQHFMGTLDDQDPALSDAFAADREVILFNNAGVASSRHRARRHSMPVTGPRKVMTGESAQPRSRPAKMPKKDFLHILRTIGVPEETIKATDEQLHDPIDLERDAVFLVTHGWDRDELINRMGGSP